MSNPGFVKQSRRKATGLPLGYDTTGCEGIGPEDTSDGDYGRILERVKGVASLTGHFIPWNPPLAGWMPRVA